MREVSSAGCNLLLLEDPSLGLEIRSGLEASLSASVIGTSSLSQCLAQPLEGAALIIADLALLPGSGLRHLLEGTVARGPSVLILLRSEDAHRAREVLESGARDCVVMGPGFLDSLAVIVRKNLEAVTERRGAKGEAAPTSPSFDSADVALAGLMHRLAGR